MKELIKYLTTQANNGVAGVSLSNSEAMQIADALERLTYPPMVQMVLAWVESLDLTYDWVGVDEDGEAFEYEKKPQCISGVWRPQGEWPFTQINDTLWTVITFSAHNRPEDFLFHRTESGWTWAAKATEC